MTKKQERIYQLLKNQYIKAILELNKRCDVLIQHRRRMKITKECIDEFKKLNQAGGGE